MNFKGYEKQLRRDPNLVTYCDNRDSSQDCFLQGLIFFRFVAFLTFWFVSGLKGCDNFKIKQQIIYQ